MCTKDLKPFICQVDLFPLFQIYSFLFYRHTFKKSKAIFMVVVLQPENLGDVTLIHTLEAVMNLIKWGPESPSSAGWRSEGIFGCQCREKGFAAPPLKAVLCIDVTTSSTWLLLFISPVTRTCCIMHTWPLEHVVYLHMMLMWSLCPLNNTTVMRGQLISLTCNKNVSFKLFKLPIFYLYLHSKL